MEKSVFVKKYRREREQSIGEKQRDKGNGERQGQKV